MVKLMKFMKHRKNETGNTTLDFFRVEKHFDGVGRYLPCTVWKHSLWKWLFIGVGQPHIESLSYCHKKNFFDLDSTWKFVELLLFWNWTRCEKLKFNAIYPLIGRNFSNAGVKHCSIFALINWKSFTAPQISGYNVASNVGIAHTTNETSQMLHSRTSIASFQH